MQQPQNPGSTPERRKYSRIDVQFKVTIAFSGGLKEGQGKLINLSRQGCAIESVKSIEQGAFLELRIFPPDGSESIHIKTASVRWVRGLDFGIEFMTIDEVNQQRLYVLLQQLEARKG